MIRVLITALLLGHFGLLASLGQTNGPNVVTNWGAPVLDTQLALTVTNNVIVAGTKTTITVWLRNSSTNKIGTATTGDEIYDSDVLLLDRAGNERVIRPLDPVRMIMGNYIVPINATSTNRIAIRLWNWDSAIVPGPYTLQVRKTFVEFVDGKADTARKHTIISGPVKVQITSPPEPKK